MRRRSFLAMSLIGAAALAHSTFAAARADEPSAFYFDNPWDEYETSVLGEIGILFVHDNLVYCEPGKFRDHGSGLYQRPFAEAKKCVEAKERLSKTNRVIATDAQGQLISTAILDDNAKWLLKRDREVEAKIRQKFYQNDRDQFGAYQIEHALGIQGKQFLTIDPEKKNARVRRRRGQKSKGKGHCPARYPHRQNRRPPVCLVQRLQRDVRQQNDLAQVVCRSIMLIGVYR